jgi:hypothetical protein
MFVTHRIDIVTTDGLTLPLTALSTSHFHNIRSLGRLWYIDSKEQRQYGVKIPWLNILLVNFILPCQFCSSEVSWLHPSHLPHQPPILSTIPVLKSHHLQGDAAAGAELQQYRGEILIFAISCLLIHQVYRQNVRTSPRVMPPNSISTNFDAQI